MDGLLRGNNGGNGGEGAGDGEEGRWLLEKAPAGAFNRERTVRVTPAVVCCCEPAVHTFANIRFVACTVSPPCQIGDDCQGAKVPAMLLAK